MTLQSQNIVLDSFVPFSLEEIGSVQLMNRVDTKYVFSISRLPYLLEQLVTHYRILEINGLRSFVYKTMYLDTPGMLFYLQHVTGRLARYKIRFRTYEISGDTFLEVKKKTNRDRTIKWRTRKYPLPGSLDEASWKFISKHIPFNSFILEPNIENTFTRITLGSSGTTERITIDTGMTYRSPEGNVVQLPFLAIAELKSEGYPSVTPFIRSVRKMGIQPSGFSKYCIGNALLMDVPKKNLLKEKMLLLNKLENEYSQIVLS